MYNKNNKNNNLLNLKNKISKNKKIVLAPMAGITDGKFCKKYKNLFAIVCIGAYDLDKDSQIASEKIVNRGRKEFLYNLDEFDNIIQQNIMDAKESGAPVSVNVRFKDINKSIDKIKTILQHSDIFELNCHCRQKEITDLGIGQELLKKENNRILKNNLKIINKINNELSGQLNGQLHGSSTPIFLKIRANFISSNELINNLNNVKDYFDGLHIDCFYPNKNCADLDYLMDLRNNFKDKIIIGNNSVNSINDAKNMLKYCDFVSVARCILRDNIEWIKEINNKTEKYIY
ncbi:MJ0144 family RNA dihydrouridine synthase-like protein [Methanococcus aeolicus]|nr:MJ0144 family RNA dihydrouridine synthase-like protein [Methanococcus aeolicus]